MTSSRVVAYIRIQGRRAKDRIEHHQGSRRGTAEEIAPVRNGQAGRARQLTNRGSVGDPAGVVTPWSL